MGSPTKTWRKKLKAISGKESRSSLKSRSLFAWIFQLLTLNKAGRAKISPKPQKDTTELILAMIQTAGHFPMKISNASILGIQLGKTKSKMSFSISNKPVMDVTKFMKLGPSMSRRNKPSDTRGIENGHVPETFATKKNMVGTWAEIKKQQDSRRIFQLRAFHQMSRKPAGLAACADWFCWTS